MFPKHAFEQDWLKRQSKTMGGCAPQILERCVHALTLLGHLQESGLPFVFRGGTCILLHLPEIHRLSIDIDIICAVTGKELESVLEAVGKRPPFTRHEESVRDGDRLPRRRHFKFFYPSALNVNEFAPPSVMLDVVEETDVIHKLESKPITTGFLEAESEIQVQLPTVDSLLADKLTAFAPTTTGVPLRTKAGTPGDVVQVVKQLFDVGMLFDHATNGTDVLETYSRAQAQEANYRGGIHSREATLDDTIAHCIAASPLKPKVQNTFPEHALLRDGYLGMRGHLTRKFTEQDFRTMAARTAFLAAQLQTGSVIDFESVRYAGTKEQIDALRAGSFNNTTWDWADGLRQVNPEAYHYWLAAARLLGISGKK
jgi:hypothetical protein